MGPGTTPLRRTLSAGEFGRAVEPAAAPAAAADDGSPALPRPSVAASAGPRFALGALLGSGATSRVYAVDDRDLARSVAIKLLAPGDGRPAAAEVERFVEEARITASLSHPNVLPVHDIDVDDSGRVFFTMTRVEGRSLGALIELSSPERREGALGDPNALVSILIGVCQALAFAHRRGIVHQDIKPDNIMLGEFGEVLVVDWGSARRGAATEDHLYGTPLYMSPEQARRERADARSDVYCIGATLFHALTLRLPTWHDDGDTFWEAKRAGAVEPPTAAERAASPAPLLAIALKALDADPRRRYQDASAMLEDLRRYQAGLAVSALRESPWQSFRRWHRRNGRAFWSWTAAAALVLALAGMLWGKHLEEIARWGQPVVEERFDDDGWRARWAAYHGDFAVRDGRLVSATGGENMVVLAQRLRGAVAIEYEGEILPGALPCDISVIWASDARFSDDGRQCLELKDMTYFQVGAFDNAYSAIVRSESDRVHLAFSPRRAEPGRRHRIRVEVDGDRLTLLLDGEVACRWKDSFSSSGGYLGIYGHYEGKAFDRIRVYQREVPAKVPATAVGDAVARAGQYEQAVAEYEQVWASHPGSALGDDARYKQGLCRWKLGQHEAAEAAWRGIAGHGHARRIELHRAELSAERGDSDAALAVIERVARDGDVDERAEAALLWGRLALATFGRHDLPAMERYLGSYDRAMGALGATPAIAAKLCQGVGRAQEILTRFPELRFYCVDVLMKAGRVREIIEQYPDQRFYHTMAKVDAGDFAGVDCSIAPVQGANALIAQGRTEEVVAQVRGGPNRFMAVRALISAGRFAEAEALLEPDMAWERSLLLIMQGRAEEVLALQLPDADAPRMAVKALGAWRMRPDLRWSAGMETLESVMAGDLSARFPVERFPRPSGSWDERFIEDLAIPFAIGAAGGGWQAADAGGERVAGRDRWFGMQVLWHDARYLLGRIDDAAYLAQPASAYGEARLPLVRAMRHERHGRRAEALADWREWSSRPPWRQGHEVDGAVNALARWRIRELSR